VHQFLSVSIIQLVFEVMAIVKLPDIDDTSFEVGATERIDELSSSQLVKAAKISNKHKIRLFDFIVGFIM